MDRVFIRSCDHIQIENIDEDADRCLSCNEILCRHNEIDPQSNCMVCGEYVQEISTEKSWNSHSYTFGNQTANAKDHTKTLRNLGLEDDVIRAAMKKYTKIDNRAKNETPIVAACTFLAFMDIGKPKTIHEVADMFSKGSDKDKLCRSKLQKALKDIYAVFPEYAVKYITISSMILPLLEKIGLSPTEVDKYHPHIHEIAKFVEKNWSSCEGSKRSTPQNIASVIIYKYVFRSPTLKNRFKKEEIVKILNISTITLSNIEKTLDKIVDFS